MTKYYQCELRRVDNPAVHTNGWIEKRGAKVGAIVDLLPERDEWEVLKVSDPALDENVLRETQRQRRQGLPSIRDTAKDKRRG